MTKYYSSERGQVLVIIAFAIIALVAITGLAIDGSQAYSDRRRAQNAADTSAFAGALAKVRGQDVVSAAQTRAASNGYNNDGVQNTVTVNNPPLAGCDGVDGPYVGNTEYVQVIINATTDTYLAPVLGIETIENCVEAITRAKPPTVVTPFDGNAVVGLDPNGFSYDAWGSSDWYIHGGGVFANGNAKGKSSPDYNVNFPDGDCVTAVGTVSGFGCAASSGNTNLFYNYPDDIIPLMPEIPPCDGVAFRDTDGKIHEEVGKEGNGSVVDHWADDFAPGLYCVTETGMITTNGNITGTGVTFYVLATNFTLKFNGGGGMAVQAPTSGKYAGVLIFSDITATPCTQNIEFRGNGTGNNVGTIFMPSACIDARGNSGASQNNSQIIGYTVSSNGTGDVEVYYNPDDNYAAPIPPKIQLTH